MDHDDPVWSITEQRTAIKRFCKQHDCDLLELYLEKSVSEVSGRRPKLKTMLAAAEDLRSFDVVVVSNAGRLSRHASEFEACQGRLAAAGVKVHCATPSFNAGPFGPFEGEWS